MSFFILTGPMCFLVVMMAMSKCTPTVHKLKKRLGTEIKKRLLLLMYDAYNESCLESSIRASSSSFFKCEERENEHSGRNPL